MQLQSLILIISVLFLQCTYSQSLGDWSSCTTSAQCASSCCSMQYSATLKCHPTGSTNRCVTATMASGTLADWSACSDSSSCASACCSQRYSSTLKCHPVGSTDQCVVGTPTSTTKTATSSSTVVPSSTVAPSGLSDWSPCTLSSSCASHCCSHQYSTSMKCHPVGTSNQCQSGSVATSSTSISSVTPTPSNAATLGVWSPCTTSSQCVSGCCSGQWSAGILKCQPAGSSNQCVVGGRTTTVSSTTTSSSAPSPTSTMIADGGSCSSSTLCANRCCTKEGSGDNQNRCQSGANAFNCLGSQLVVVADKCVEAGMIALTYDDGPQNSETGIVSVLNSKGVKATFFMNGDNFVKIQDQAAIVQATYNAGHQVASHSWSHPDMATLSFSDQVSQITQLDTAFMNIIGKKPAYFRPPYGSYNSDTLTALSQQGYRYAITWNVDTNDWRNNLTPPEPHDGAVEFDNAVSTGNPHSNSYIVLMHEQVAQTSSPWTAEIIANGKARGYRFVTMSQCMGDAAGGYQ